MIVQENVSLAPFTTFRVGGDARYFVSASTEEELIQAIKLAQERKIEVFVLGGGSNLIVSDNGFDGLVIKMDVKQYRAEKTDIFTQAAVPFAQIVNLAAEKSLAGLEWAGGIPGTVGGAVRGNAGAFGGETKDIVKTVTSIDIKTAKKVTRKKEECGFGYRESIFKHNNEIITEVVFSLTIGNKEDIISKVRSNIQYRLERHPHDFPSAGSVFKNVPVENISSAKLRYFQESVKTDPFPVVPAAKIIAEAGLSGYRVGGAQVSPKHTNYIINCGNAVAGDILELIERIKKVVKEKFDIELQIEQYVVK